jgi:hypothetical protein
MKNNFIKISIGILAFSLFASCALINKQMFREKRPFQERNFDAKLWREGDPQTRGEMSKDLRWKKTESGRYLLDDKNQQEILAILGEPDRKTRGRCCGAGGTFDEEVWLYNIDVKTGDSTITEEHFQIYFTESGKVDEWRIALWDDKKPDYFPRVG